MPELLEAPVVPNPSEQVSVVDEMYEFDQTPMELSKPEETKHPEPEPESEPAAAAKPEVKPEAKVEPAKHPAEVLELARERYGISDEEAAAMSPTELTRAMAYLERQTQRVWEAAKQQPAAKQESAPVPEPEYDFVANPLGLDPTVISELKRGREAAKKTKELEERLNRLEPSVQDAKMLAVHQRIGGLVKEMGEEVAAKMPIGSPAFDELMVTMKFVQDKGTALGKRYSEKEIFERATREMGITKVDSKKAEKEASLEERKKEFDAGALAKGGSRAGDPDVYKTVRDLLKKQRAPVADKKEPVVEWTT